MYVHRHRSIPSSRVFGQLALRAPNIWPGGRRTRGGGRAAYSARPCHPNCGIRAARTRRTGDEARPPKMNSRRKIRAGALSDRDVGEDSSRWSVLHGTSLRPRKGRPCPQRTTRRVGMFDVGFTTGDTHRGGSKAMPVDCKTPRRSVSARLSRHQFPGLRAPGRPRRAHRAAQARRLRQPAQAAEQPDRRARRAAGAAGQRRAGRPPQFPGSRAARRRLPGPGHPGQAGDVRPADPDGQRR